MIEFNDLCNMIEAIRIKRGVLTEEKDKAAMAVGYHVAEYEFDHLMRTLLVLEEKLNYHYRSTWLEKLKRVIGAYRDRARKADQALEEAHTEILIEFRCLFPNSTTTTTTCVVVFNTVFSIVFRTTRTFAIISFRQCWIPCRRETTSPVGGNVLSL